ncbi:hypothetical protein [Kitasatospora purpeofusca]|uniref:hypothetical protein n=1 Tax=Kitasatospora purpeofusca TaxID=67352 RepID=UPI002252BCF0|nr:hypothetical protein [Kitasatospora purpeofusca]MCX4752535.1 hypothetical protein [Kitasatospora purpeofusca]WSR32105.1 hypothetical protein OG715_14575 [Kitasatospora purpeofusca]
MSTPESENGTRTVISTSAAPVEGLPTGLGAYPVYRERYEDGAVKGRSRLVALKIKPIRPPAPEAAQQALDSMDDKERRFVLASPTRRGVTVTRRYPALQQLSSLILADVVTVTTKPPGLDKRAGDFVEWEQTQATRTYAARAKGDAVDRRAELQTEALSFAQQIRRQEPEAAPLAAALELPRDAGRLDLYVAAARALLSGEVFLGVRDFSSRLRNDTKAVDADKALTDIGVNKAVRERLGVLKYPELAISGPLTIRQGRGHLQMQGLGVLVTVPFTPDPMVLNTCATELVVVENKEAAAFLARHLPDHVVVWCSGFSGEELHHVLLNLGSTCPRAWVVPDADTDGVHIASLVIASVPHAVVVDVGLMPGAKARRDRTYAGSRTLRRLIEDTAVAPQVRRFAEQVETRGFEVEQEEFMPEVLSFIVGR